LIKVEVPDLPPESGYTPCRLEVDLADGEVRRGVAKRIGVDGSVGILWNDAKDGQLDFVQLQQHTYKWLGPPKPSETGDDADGAPTTFV